MWKLHGFYFWFHDERVSFTTARLKVKRVAIGLKCEEHEFVWHWEKRTAVGGRQEEETDQTETNTQRACEWRRKHELIYALIRCLQPSRL